MATPNILDCETLLKLLPTLLPNNNNTSDHSTESSEQEAEKAAAEPTTLLATEYAALAAFSHTVMTAVGFRFVGLGEDHKVTKIGEESSTSEADNNILPLDWDTSSSFAFKYSHPQSQLTFLVKAMRLADKFVIHGTTLESSKLNTLEIITKDFTSHSYFPYTTATEDPLWNGFISRSRVNDLTSQLKVQIVQPLIPGLNKPGYQEETSASSASSSSSTSTAANPQRGGRGGGDYENDPLRIPGSGGRGGFGGPGFPRPPIFGDPFSAEDPGFEGGFGGGRNPYEIGRSDLDPFGGRFGGGGGFGVLGGIGGSSGGGMYVGPNHPMFGGGRGGMGGGRGDFGGVGGIYGGPQPLPRGSVPPGARFDPIGPFGAAPGQGRGVPDGNAPGAGTAHGRGARPRQFPGEPDNDDLQPPGYNDMFM